MEQTIIEPPQFKRFDIPLKWGIVIAIFNIIAFTVVNMFLVSNMIAYFAGLIITFIITVILLGVVGKKQRTAMGGYITFKQAFQAIFISILIVCVANFLYTYIYMMFIDPDFMAKMKESTIAFTEKMGASQDQIDDAARQFDEQEKTKSKFSSQILSLFWTIVVYSIFGFICAAIVKRNRPASMQ